MIKKVELPLSDNRILSLETGKLAKEAAGSVIVRLGDTMVIATAVSSQTPREGINFFPLLVDFEEKLYAVGKIPGGFFKREGKPTELAILTARRIDRPLRPLFPKGFRNDVQIVITPLSVDQDNPPDILSIIGASAALSISDIPFEGPIGACRVAKCKDKFIIDPVVSEMQESSMDLIVAGTKEKILMIEAGAEEASEEDIVAAIKIAHKTIKEIIKIQEDLIAVSGKKKIEVKFYEPDPKIKEFVQKNATSKIEKAKNIPDKDKEKAELKNIEEELKEKIKEKNENIAKLIEEKPFDIQNVIEDIEKTLVRDSIANKGKRPDGRGPKDIRPISCEVGVLPRAHGSAIFTRGQTQVLTVSTLGALGEVQRLEGLGIEEAKRYMHHYNFPAFSVGEVKPMRGPGRREIGHGALAERALLPAIPSEEEFPYAIRLVSEVLASNGSTSMASTCGSSLALMDAGVKIDSPVAGISIGLVKEDKKEILLTDIQGIEDHFGDMDFKVAGTEKGITAIQVDIKIKGLTHELIKKALDQAKEGRLFILKEMKKAISKAREELSPHAPRVLTFEVNPDKIGLIIGPGGKTIKKIIEETNVKIDIEDSGKVFITAPDQDAAKAAKKQIDNLVFEYKVGDVFEAEVVKIMPFGAFVEFPNGKEGLLHISQISEKRIAKVEDALKMGDKVIVKVVSIDDLGRYNLSKKAVTSEDINKYKENLQ